MDTQIQPARFGQGDGSCRHRALPEGCAPEGIGLSHAKTIRIMEKKSKVYVAGHRGMVGSAIVRRLGQEGFTNIIERNSSELDLRDQHAVNEFFANEKPEYVFLAAAKVGG